MQTIRRLYFYIISFLSLEVMLWGLVILVRTLLDTQPEARSLQPLAEGLAMICTGIPIFWLHWYLTQRLARRDSEESNSRLRAFFLYGVRFATLIPVAQNTLAVLNRLALRLLGEAGASALVGRGQDLGDNLTAIVINLVVWNLFESILRKDWGQDPDTEALSEIRRLFRYIWLLYGLGLGLAGGYQILNFLLHLPSEFEKIPLTQLANGLALILVGVPILSFIWQIIKINLVQAGERQSMLRLVVFYLLSFTGAGTTLISAVIVLDRSVNWLLGGSTSFPFFARDISDAVGLLLPFSILWTFYYRQLSARIQIEDEQQGTLLQIYDTVLALFGNFTVFSGLLYLSAALAEELFGQWLINELLRDPMATGLACLAVGLPFWLRHWLRLEAQSKSRDPGGDLIRRSIVRRGYLYLLLLLCVAGGMTNTVQIFQLVFTRLLGTAQSDFSPLLARHAFSFFLFLSWGLYHLHVLQRDNRLAQKALEARHLRMLTLIFTTGEDHTLAYLTIEALNNRAPNIPCFIHELGKDTFSELVEVKVCVLDLDLAIHPPNALRLWLQDYHGHQIIIPTDAEEIVLVGEQKRSLREMAEETARLICQIAEGQPARSRGRVSPWTLLAYVFASIFGVLLLVVGFSALFSLFD